MFAPINKIQLIIFSVDLLLYPYKNKQLKVGFLVIIVFMNTKNKVCVYMYVRVCGACVRV